MPEIPVESLADPRLDAYRDLKQPHDASENTFIAEGEKLVVRLLASSCRTASVLCTEAALERLRPLIPAEVPVFVASTPEISRLIGFQFHRGVLACGFRPEPLDWSTFLDGLQSRPRALVVLCPEIRDPENLGTIIRTAAAFGAAGVVAGLAGTDPFSRRVLRTSMGSVLRLPILQTDDWGRMISALHDAQFSTIATVLDADAVPLRQIVIPERVAILLGNEAAGLPENLSQSCRLRVTLPMAEGVDSLNVAVAAGIVLHHFSARLR